MAQQWFKFYGGEYLYDPKVKSLSAPHRSCWITLLSYASVSEDEGIIKHLTEQQLMLDAGISPLDDEWKTLQGVLQIFVEKRMITIDNEMITVINWNKKQEKILTPYERLKRYRNKNDNALITDDNEMITRDNANDNTRVEKSREEENRVDKKEYSTQKYLSNIPSSDLKEFTERFIATEKQIKSKAEDLLLYCQSKRKTYSNYKSFLLNALKKDFKERLDAQSGGKYKNL